MIFKSDLVEAINDLSHDLFALSVRVHDLESKVTKVSGKIKELEKKNCPCKSDKNNLEEEIKNAASKKSTKAKKQPRDKSGKFTKK